MSKEAMKLALEGAANYIDALGGDSRKYRQTLANEALDKMAENARELGLDYEPAQEPVETYIHEFTKHPHPGDFGIPIGHWWQAKNYAEQLCACYPAPQPAQPEQEQHMKTVIEMVRAAGFPKWDDHEPVTVDMYARFADLIRADERDQGQKWFDAVTAQHKQEILAEREACAKVAEQVGQHKNQHGIAAAIRARSNT